MIGEKDKNKMRKKINTSIFCELIHALTNEGWQVWWLWPYLRLRPVKASGRAFEIVWTQYQLGIFMSQLLKGNSMCLGPGQPNQSFHRHWLSHEGISKTDIFGWLWPLCLQCCLKVHIDQSLRLVSENASKNLAHRWGIYPLGRVITQVPWQILVR